MVIPKHGCTAVEGVTLSHTEMYSAGTFLPVSLVPAAWALLCAPLPRLLHPCRYCCLACRMKTILCLSTMYWKTEQHGAQRNSSVRCWRASAPPENRIKPQFIYSIFQESLFLTKTQPHCSAIFPGTGLCLMLELDTEYIYCPPHPSKLTEQPLFTITCHPNKLEGRDTSHLNQLVAVSE